jgi:GntR family transcriptional regulator
MPPLIDLRVDPRTGTPVYLQIVQQVRNALRLGVLRPGDQMPTVRELVATLAINPNTVMRAYRELEAAGLISGRAGQGTFVRETLPGPSAEELAELGAGLDAWLARARELGLDDEIVTALIETARRGPLGAARETEPTT